MVKGEIIENGDLKISLLDSWKRFKTKDDIKKFLKSRLKSKATNDTIRYLLRKLPGYKQIQPEDIGALTSAPIVTKANEKRDNPSVIWVFNDYMIKDEIEELIEHGYVIFNKEE